MYHDSLHQIITQSHMCRLTGTIHGEYRVNVTVKDDDPISTLSVNQVGLDIVIVLSKATMFFSNCRLLYSSDVVLNTPHSNTNRIKIVRIGE